MNALLVAVLVVGLVTDVILPIAGALVAIWDDANGGLVGS